MQGAASVVFEVAENTAAKGDVLCCGLHFAVVFGVKVGEVGEVGLALLFGGLGNQLGQLDRHGAGGKNIESARGGVRIGAIEQGRAGQLPYPLKQVAGIRCVGNVFQIECFTHMQT